MTILLPVHKISPPQWMRDPDLIRVLDLLNKDDINARMVGGCIRNHYFNKPVYDIDIACKTNSMKSIEILTSNAIRVIETGIKHGTITAHINGKNFEITQLRRDIETDGRHAKIEITNDWTEDAQRRDFTINALYADKDGNIYDPLDGGFSDLQNHIVRFIGDAETRITEDALRILRYFRFYGEYHSGKPDEESLNACVKLKDKIHALSDERIYDEVFKILKSDGAYCAMDLMQQAHIFPIEKDNIEHLKNLIELQNQLEKQDLPSRYHLLKIDNKYIKNNKQNKFINLLSEFISGWDGNIKRALYAYDRNIVIQGIFILKSQGHVDIDDMIITRAMNDKIPKFPIIASDIMNHFKIPEGRSVGEKMKLAEKIWIESNFKLSHDEILKQIMA